MAAHALLPYDVKEDWNETKLSRMRAVVRQKFSPELNPDLARKLVATGDAALIEDSKTDTLWGIGKNGDGMNMLGHILMEVRLQIGGLKTK